MIKYVNDFPEICRYIISPQPQLPFPMLDVLCNILENHFKIPQTRCYCFLYRYCIFL